MNNTDTTDWKALGLKCGIEIHQQLEGKKLFCSCPTTIRADPSHKKIYRIIRASAGESGAIDIAALQESKKQRIFVYETYNDTNCLVETDEEPPHEINKKALETAVLFAKMANAKLVDSIHVMRKTIVNGSNTSGFQRTALIALNGDIKSSFGHVGIHTVILEEDSARTIEETKDTVIYNLDRIGIPLIEVCTAPEMHQPEQVREIAEKIGLMLRSTETAKRGLGTIRQDVNVSIAGGARVEIKGAQDLKLLSDFVKLEALRQKKLLEIRDIIKKRKYKEQKSIIIDITEDLRVSNARVIKTAIEQGGTVLACKFEKLQGIFGIEVQPNRRFGSECSDRAKVIAGVGGIFHSDELPKYGITQSEVDSIKGTLQVKPEDAFVLVADQKERSQKALEAVITRVNESLLGVPQEVRKPNEDGTTNYLRPMPTAERMYPETDVPAFTLSALGSLQLPELIEDRKIRYEKLGLSKDVADLAARSENWKNFDMLLDFKNIKPSYIAEIIFGSIRAIKTQFNTDINPSSEDFNIIFMALEQGKISKESVLEILKENKPVKEIIDKFMLISDTELQKKIKTIITKNKNTPLNALIGIAMKELRGKASGQKIAEMIKKIVM